MIYANEQTPLSANSNIPCDEELASPDDAACFGVTLISLTLSSPEACSVSVYVLSVLRPRSSPAIELMYEIFGSSGDESEKLHTVIRKLTKSYRLWLIGGGQACVLSSPRAGGGGREKYFSSRLQHLCPAGNIFLACIVNKVLRVNTYLPQ